MKKDILNVGTGVTGTSEIGYLLGRVMVYAQQKITDIFLQKIITNQTDRRGRRSLQLLCHTDAQIQISACFVPTLRSRISPQGDFTHLRWISPVGRGSPKSRRLFGGVDGFHCGARRLVPSPVWGQKTSLPHAGEGLYIMCDSTYRTHKRISKIPQGIYIDACCPTDITPP